MTAHAHRVLPAVGIRSMPGGGPPRPEPRALVRISLSIMPVGRHRVLPVEGIRSMPGRGGPGIERMLTVTIYVCVCVTDIHIYVDG